MTSETGEVVEEEQYVEVAVEAEDESLERVPPMTAYEKEVLLTLVDEYKIAIENKRTDFRTTNEKTRAWKEIEARFNSAEGTYKRSIEQLRTKWKNNKQRTKKKLGLSKRVMRQSEEQHSAVNSIADGAEKISCEEIIDESHKVIETLRGATEKLSQLNYTKTRYMNGKAGGMNEFEFEEHKMRMRILQTQLETAEILKRKAEQELLAVEKEHDVRMELVRNQMGVIVTDRME